jgi:hypothetical protein
MFFSSTPTGRKIRPDEGVSACGRGRGTLVGEVAALKTPSSQGRDGSVRVRGVPMKRKMTIIRKGVKIGCHDGSVCCLNRVLSGRFFFPAFASAMIALQSTNMAIFARRQTDPGSPTGDPAV